MRLSLYKSIVYSIEREKNLASCANPKKSIKAFFKQSASEMDLRYRNTSFPDRKRCSHQALRLFADEFLNMTILDIRPKEDVGKLQIVVRRNCRPKKAISTKARLQHRKKNGDNHRG